MHLKGPVPRPSDMGGLLKIRRVVGGRRRFDWLTALRKVKVLNLSGQHCRRLSREEVNPTGLYECLTKLDSEVVGKKKLSGSAGVRDGILILCTPVGDLLSLVSIVEHQGQHTTTEKLMENGC